MKIKDRLIHLLGGITKEESNLISQANNRFPAFGSDHRVKTLKAGYTIQDYFHHPNQNWLTYELVSKLANKMIDEKLITIYTVPRNTGESEYPQDVYAVVKVVEPSDEGWM